MQRLLKIVGFTAVALVGTSLTATAAVFSEATLGDFSNVPTSPTQFHTLSLGDNYVIGNSDPSGPVVDDHGTKAIQDFDFFTFTIAPGDQLSNFIIEQDSVIVPGDRFFLGLYQGSSAPADLNPYTPTPEGLYGYTLPGNDSLTQVSSSGVVGDLLPDIVAGDEPGFPDLGGTYSGPLQAGAYTVWLVDGDNSLSYDLDLRVSAVPEPATWMLLIAGVGLLGAMLRRRPTRTIQAGLV